MNSDLVTMRFSCTVAGNTGNRALSGYLAQRFTYHDEQEWLGHLDAGRVLINGRAATRELYVQGGDTLTYTPLPFAQPPADLGYSVVYEDDWILGINKTGNLLVHRSGRSFTNNLVYRVRTGFSTQAWPQAGAVNRLDRETSGVVLIAKEPRGRALFQHCFRDGRVEKRYGAVVHRGENPLPEFIDAPLGPDPAFRGKQRIEAGGGKPSRTRIERWYPCGSAHAFLYCMPLTGRTHQIRVHCSSVGWTIVGDKCYGLCTDDYLRWRESPQENAPMLEFPRQALHCLSLSFQHPVTGNQCEIHAALPPDMRELITRLGGELPVYGIA